MDLDYARRRIQEAKDVPPLSDVLLELLETVSAIDQRAAQTLLRVQDLEQQVAALTVRRSAPEGR
jgi:hypothetical protein